MTTKLKLVTRAKKGDADPCLIGWCSLSRSMRSSIDWKKKYLFNPIDDSAKELTITPYLKLPKQGEWGVVREGVETIVDMKQYEGVDLMFESFAVKLP